MCAETLEDFIDLNYANGLSSIVVKIHEFKFYCRVCSLCLSRHIFSSQKINRKTRVPRNLFITSESEIVFITFVK